MQCSALTVASSLLWISEILTIRAKTNTLNQGWMIHKTAKNTFYTFLFFSNGSRPLYMLEYLSVSYQIKAPTQENKIEVIK